jgi:hypothetical protein
MTKLEWQTRALPIAQDNPDLVIRTGFAIGTSDFVGLFMVFLQASNLKFPFLK